MDKKTWILATLTAAILGGCSNSPEAPSASKTPTATPAYAYKAGSIKKGEMALCTICVVNEGATATEPAVETIDYEGKTYAFCNEEEKAQFISSPTKFAAKK